MLTISSKKISVSIAIPAFNEMATIGNLLDILMTQNQTSFRLLEIVVYSDGSTDATCDIVTKKQNEYPCIRLIHEPTRRGKMYRLNQIFRSCQGDIFVVLDADVLPVGKNFLEKLVRKLQDDENACMVAAHQVPIRPSRLTGKIMYASFVLWDYVRLGIPNQDHVQNFYGAATAYRSSFAQLLILPSNATEERIYIYLMAKKNNGFRYTFDAYVQYWPVMTWRDFFALQNRSFGTDQHELRTLFGNAIDSLHIVPRKYLLRGIARSFYYQPLYTIPALSLNFFLGRFFRKKNIVRTPLWDIALSTKIPINSSNLQQ